MLFYISALLYGPPGCGKSFLAKIIAKETNMALMEVTSANLVDKYIGETARNVSAMFQVRWYSHCTNVHHTAHHKDI